MSRRPWPLCLVAVVACGRLGFDAIGDRSGDGGGSDDAPSTGSAGPRYLIELDANPTAPAIAGKQGRVAVLEGFQGAITVVGTALAGQAMYASSGLVWLDPTGVAASSTVLDSTSTCQIRTLGNAVAGDGVLAAGFSQAGATTPGYGPCAIATSRQDGIAIAIDTAASQSLVADVQSSPFNIQTWFAAGHAGGDVALTGIYGGGGMLGSASLPATSSDENPFLARVDPTTHLPRWAVAVTSTDSMGAGPIDPDGDDLCATGSFSGNQTVFGTALTSAGLRDVWIARFDRDGTPRFVRALGSSTQDSVGAGASIVATSDGGCTLAAPIAGDVAIDSFSLPVAQDPVVVVRFDATGVATAAIRTGGVQLAHLGDRVFAALPCTATCKLSDLSYAAIGDDVVIASLDPQFHATQIAALTGGAKTLVQLAAVSPDALAVAFSASAPTTFGALSLTPTAPGPVNALALYGVAPAQ
jgi:hypothetical protein